MPRHTLRSTLSIFAVLLAITITIGLSIISGEVATDYLEQRIGQQLARRSVELSDKLDRILSERYEDIINLGQDLPELDLLTDATALRERLSKLHAGSEGYAWIGFARHDGNVLAATDGILEVK